MSNPEIWNECLHHLKHVLSPEDVNTWLLPLHCVHNAQTLKLLAPNRYILNYIKKNLYQQIQETILALNLGIEKVQFELGSYGPERPSTANMQPPPPLSAKQSYTGGVINHEYTFDTHVEGTSNQLARAAAFQVGENPGTSFNPLFIYGDVGLGKTHLMHAAGNLLLQNNPKAKVVYVRSELFVNNMVKALKNNTMNEFKQYYRSLDTLLIDDIQFFAGKTQSQEEFFHTFNALLEGHRQIIITSDRIPKAIGHVEERLISRLGNGLTVSIDLPELETRVAILEKKALAKGVELPDDVAFFVANTIRSNVRELEGALHRIFASAGFTGRAIDIHLAREALLDLLAYQEQRITIENIQQTVAGYYKIKVADILSKKRSRDIVRPRQMAMYLTKEYTNMSLPQIGDRFGGRDHTTVLHACRKMENLIQTDPRIKEDHRNLQRLFGG